VRSEAAVVAALDLTGSEILSLTVIAAVVTTIGNLVATWLKEFVFVRSFERWKERRSLASVKRRYRDPLLLSAQELRWRVAEIVDLYPPPYLRASVLHHRPDIARNDLADPYYQRYRLESTVFRLCAFLGWLELYRRELTFLHGRRLDRKLAETLERVRDDLANGELNTAPDLRDWSDRLIFREEQRAIGESMIVRDATPSIMGYARFYSLSERADADRELWWLLIARGFFLDPEADLDFRRERLERVRGHLIAAIKLLQQPAGPFGAVRAAVAERRSSRRSGRS
jgi:hypothetical protein